MRLSKGRTLPRGPWKAEWHKAYECHQVAQALLNQPPMSGRERFLTPTSARREAELLGDIKIGEFGEVKP